MTTKPVHILIAVLTLCFGISTTLLIYLYKNGGPAFPPDPPVLQNSNARVAQPPSAVSSQKELQPPAAPETHLSLGTPATPPPPPDPQYDWIEVRKESFVLDPGARVVYGPTPGSDAGHPLKAHFIRYDIKSTSPVDTGALGAEWFKNSTDQESIFRYFFGSSITLCYTAKNLQSEHSCRLTGSIDSGYVLLRDSRSTSPINSVSPLAGAALGVKEPLKNQMKENRVTLTFYEWQCIRFCQDIHRH